MSRTSTRAIGLLALISVLTILCSCSSAPTGPKMGTPAFYWGAAKEVYVTGDYNKTLEHLDKLLASENEFVDKALPWDLVLKAGMAAGYAEIAENYQVGSHLNRSDPSLFRRQVTDSRQAAGRMALQFAEDYGKLSQIKGDTIPMAFAMPLGTASPVAQFSKVTNGIQLAATEADTAQKRALERGVLLETCKALGAPEDTAKAADVLKTGTATVPRATFMMAMAQTLYDFSQLYVSEKLDQPQKLEIFCDRALDALKSVPESKETKALTDKIQAAVKKSKKG